ncbi:hypothetical protein ACTXT7_008393 [Hymenolepis weldensis]
MLLKLPRILLILFAGLACLEQVQGWNYHEMMEDSSLRQYDPPLLVAAEVILFETTCRKPPSAELNIKSQRWKRKNRWNHKCSEDGEECMLSTHCCPGLFCAVQGSIGTCLRHESELTRCKSDIDCPQSKCCHRERHRGEIGICAYVCGDKGEILEESVHSRR